jgi:hypothetical protein
MFRETSSAPTIANMICTPAIGLMRQGPPAMDGTIRNRQDFCSDLTVAAERELAAFVVAVGQLFGPEEARQAAEDWLEGLALFDYSSSRNLPSCRQITVAAAQKLACRVST